MSIVFIETRRESEIAARVANEYYPDEFQPKEFYKRYTHNVLGYLPNGSTKHTALKAIAHAISQKRVKHHLNYHNLPSQQTREDQRIEAIEDDNFREDRLWEAATSVAASKYGVPYGRWNRGEYDLFMGGYTVEGLARAIWVDWRDQLEFEE